MKPASLLIVFLLLSGCKTSKPLGTTTSVRERLVPVAMPTYFGSVKVYVGCDSSGQVIVRGLDQSASPEVDLSFKRDSNSFGIAFKSRPDTVYIPARDSIVETTLVKTVTVEIPWWKNALMFLGLLLLVLSLFKLKKIM